ncbi:hypothetical protein LSAT2_005897 [Lamellibrachia satsuma]|nr:hypothetical protein LSAT2_005897 [Lamellibrachia satsuma]
MPCYYYMATFLASFLITATVKTISLCSTDPDNVMQGRHVVIVLAPDTSQSSQCSCRIASTNVGRGGRINVTLVSIRSLGRSDYCLALVQFDVHGSSGDVGFCAGNQKAAGSVIVSGHAWDVHLQLRQRHPYLTRLSISVEASVVDANVTCSAGEDVPPVDNYSYRPAPLNLTVYREQSLTVEHKIEITAGAIAAICVVVVSLVIAISAGVYFRMKSHARSHATSDGSQESGVDSSTSPVEGRTTEGMFTTEQ